jgi:GDPmannose 4,6-dehydratase
LDWLQHVQTDNSLLRPSDIAFGAGNPALAARVLGWSAKCDVDGVVARMCNAAARSARNDP